MWKKKDRIKKKMWNKNMFLIFFYYFFFFWVDKFASYVIFFLIIKLKKKKKVFEFHLNSFFLFMSSSSQPKILSIYTHSFLVYYSFYYIPYNYLLYSSFLLSILPTTLQVIFFSFIKLNRFCVFVAFLLYIIWFLSINFIDRLKFYVWSHLSPLCPTYNLAGNFFFLSSNWIDFVYLLPFYYI